jgi:hypothetical protein
MSEQRTCGQGLTANAGLPAAMGKVLAGMAQNLAATETPGLAKRPRACRPRRGPLRGRMTGQSGERRWAQGVADQDMASPRTMRARRS